MRFWVVFSPNSIIPGSNTPPNKKAPGADRINTQQEEENNQNNKNTGNNKKKKDKEKQKKRKNDQKSK